MTHYHLAFIFILGLCVGSFCNVLIFRLPRNEEFVKTPSHCMSCGHSLNWYENIPVLSWLIQGGKCHHCKTPISKQYPLVEAANGVLWLLIGILYSEGSGEAADWLHIGLYCALTSLLIVLSLIDWRTFEIPNGINVSIFVLGLIQVAAIVSGIDAGSWFTYVLGSIAAGGLFFFLWFITGGTGMGFGDVKLMFSAGLLLGFPRILLALILGSISGAVIHSIRMKRGAGRKLAFGPYLALGIEISALFGTQIITSYLSLFGL